MEGIPTIVFPPQIGFMEVSEYMERFNQIEYNTAITFDLRDSVSIHSSFIGFLIHAKHMISKNNGKMTLILSLTAEKVLAMLNILDYFASEIIVLVNKKTA